MNIGDWGFGQSPIPKIFIYILINEKYYLIKKIFIKIFIKKLRYILFK